MLEILKTLTDTPLPSILVIAGILFLLILFVDKIGSSIELKAGKKWLAGLLGLAFMCTGVSLYLIPILLKPTSVTPLPTAIQDSADFRISVQLPSDLSCQWHSTGYCGLAMTVSWSNVDTSAGYYIYTIGHGLNYKPLELWWVAGNGVPIETTSGSWTITDGAYGMGGENLGVFACLTKTRYGFDGVSAWEFVERPSCEIYSAEIIFQPQ